MILKPNRLQTGGRSLTRAAHTSQLGHGVLQDVLGPAGARAEAVEHVGERRHEFLVAAGQLLGEGRVFDGESIS